MKKAGILTSILVAMLLMLGLVSPVAAQVDPPEVMADLAPGESLVVDKEVGTPEIPPKPDIYFMSDTTGSMGGTIGAVSANADAILAAIAAVQPDAQFGVGNYRDYPYDLLPPFYHQLNITDDTVAVSAEIGNWVAAGGGDGPEGQFYALTQIADPGVDWRDGSTKIVVWFGDAPAHDPVPVAATGLGYDITEATVTKALVDAGIRVIAISLPTGGYAAGLDDDPTLYGGNYAAAYPPTVEDGSTGQASRIAAATGGSYLFAATPDEVVDAILEGLSNLPITVTPVVVEPCDFLDITFEPSSRTVISGEIAAFTETITVAENAPQCETVCCAVAFIDETTGKVIGEQKICIHVLDITSPEVWCQESVNPHGNNIPGEKRSDNAKDKAKNPDGFYQLCAEDNCDAPEMIKIWVVYRFSEDPLDRVIFPEDPYNNPDADSFSSGDVIKITQAPGAVPSMKKIGSSNGKAGAVIAHITVPKDTFEPHEGMYLLARDTSGNFKVCSGCCLVPPPPK